MYLFLLLTRTSFYCIFSRFSIALPKMFLSLRVDLFPLDTHYLVTTVCRTKSLVLPNTNFCCGNCKCCNNSKNVISCRNNYGTIYNNILLFSSFYRSVRCLTCAVNKRKPLCFVTLLTWRLLVPGQATRLMGMEITAI